MNEPASPTANFSCERSAARNHPTGWLPTEPDNPKLHAVYDWKVMHDHPHSGRSFQGRSSVMLAAQPGAGANVGRTIAWDAHIDVPDGPLEKQIIRVQAHGEGLAGIAAAGMAVRFLDAEGKPFDTKTVACPTVGTFAWRPLELPWRFDQETKKLHVRLFLKARLFLRAAETQNNAGRLWFDSFEIVPAAPVEQSDLQVVAEAGGCLRLKARPGVDLACVPFRVDSKELPDILQFKLRADRPMPVTVRWLGGKTVEMAAEITVEAGEKWTRFEMPLALDKPVGDARVIVRPRAAATLWIDDVELR